MNLWTFTRIYIFTEFHLCAWTKPQISYKHRARKDHFPTTDYKIKRSDFYKISLFNVRLSPKLAL